MLTEKKVREIIEEVISSESFMAAVTDAIREEFASGKIMGALKRHITNQIKAEVSNKKLTVFLELEAGDVIVLPEGIDDESFRAITSIIPEDKILGVVAADNIKVIRFS